VPAISPYIFEPIFEQFRALLPEREVDHPLGCHRSRIPDHVVFEKLVLRYWCSVAPTGGLLTRSVLLLRCAVGEMSG
jgi:hypothetical protein